MVHLLQALVLVGLGLPALGAVTIAPVVVDVAPDGRAVIMVRNDRAREVMYQVAILRWRLEDGVDRYEATEDFIASPPLFTLASAASLPVRIGFRNPAPLPVEQSYRLVLTEVPRPSDTQAGSGMVEFSMQYVIPVFVAPSSRAAKQPLLWQMREEGSTMVVRADNPSQSRAVLNMVGLSSQTGPTPSAESASRERATVLAHSWREWRLPIPEGKTHPAWRIVVLAGDGETPMIVPDADMRPYNAR